jgi:hypothetical protein
MRAAARGFAGAPNTVLLWRVEAAAHRRALAGSVLCDGPVNHLPRDAWSAVVRGVKDGERSAQEARNHLARAPPWGWTAIDPERKWLLALAVGPRPLPMAQGGVPQVVQG